MNKLTLLLISILVSLGCARAPLVLQPIEGDKSDGLIYMSYRGSPGDNPVVDWHETQVAALHQCSFWGYSSKGGFTYIRWFCIDLEDNLCIEWQADIAYQCMN